MVFSSITFVFYFLPLFLLAYYAIPSWRNHILLGFSLIFYAWGEPTYILLLITSILLNYFCGLLIGSVRDEWRGWMLATGIAANLGILFFFKYASFSIGSLEGTLDVVLKGSWFIKRIALPLGISFFTFQAMSYLVDVYRRHVPMERNPLTLGTYITMFPQLVAGPIVRYETVYEELHQRQLDTAAIATGIRLFILGLAAKVLLANTVAGPVDEIFARAPQELSMGTAWFGGVCYGLQIYFDFMGYSTMAIGLGLMLGFHFPQNFNSPYIAPSITDFWRRWHISLSTWFRDYLYIPLGGNRHSAGRTYLNLLIVFLLCGAWHGANWTFVVWGLYQGVFLILERASRDRLQLPAWLRRGLSRPYTLLAVLGGWIIFRSETMTYAGRYFQAMAGLDSTAPHFTVPMFLTPYFLMVFTIALILALTDLGKLSARLATWRASLNNSPITSLMDLATTTAMMILFLACAASLASGTHNPFIYFRF